MQVSKAVPQPDEPRFAPATVSDRIDIGIMIKYMLKFDDGVVSGQYQNVLLDSSTLLCTISQCSHQTCPECRHAPMNTLFAAQVVEMHLKGVEHERPIAFDLQQRVYVRTDPQNLVAYYPDEIASTPL